MSHSLENLKVTVHKVLNVLCNNKLIKTSELKNVEKLVKQTVQSLKPY